jgi:hypothetical protein
VVRAFERALLVEFPPAFPQKIASNSLAARRITCLGRFSLRQHAVSYRRRRHITAGAKLTPWFASHSLEPPHGIDSIFLDELAGAGLEGI